MFSGIKEIYNLTFPKAPRGFQVGEMMNIFARVSFYPTLFYNVVMEKVTSRNWYDRIDETVVLGALPFRSLTKKLVEDENVKGIVTMNEEYETRYLVNNMEEWAAAGIEQLRLNTIDLGVAPNQENLLQGVQFIMKHRNNQDSVYVHCKAGRSRSATLVVCYLMQLHQCSPEDAMTLVKRRRPHVWIAPKQKQAIEAYFKNIRKDNVSRRH